jgi:hypothetical protein
MIRKIVLAAMLATSLGTMATIATPAVAAVVVRVAPPPPREEVAPGPRHGYVWVAGYWDYRNNRHHWVKGTWVKERRGYHYNQSNWVERDGRWHLERGKWSRADRDGDGVPNSRDRAPDNPNRR